MATVSHSERVIKRFNDVIRDFDMENKELVITRNGSGWEVFLEGKIKPILTSKSQEIIIQKARDYAKQNDLRLYAQSKVGVKYYWGPIPAHINIEDVSKSILQFKKMKADQRGSGKNLK